MTLGRQICGAPTKSDSAAGATCRLLAVRGSTRCHHHLEAGEAAGRPRGLTVPGNDRVSRYGALRGRLAQHFERALADETILDPVRDLAMEDALIQRTLEEAHNLDTPAWRTDLKHCSDRMRTAHR